MAIDIEKATVLFVDDEESILNALKRELYDEKYKCLFALSGNQALKIMQTKKISVIVSDMKMPEMDGLRLLKLVREKHPDTVRVVLSGYTQLPQVLVTINQAEVFKFLTKPWGEELKSVILQAISYHCMLRDRARIEQLLDNQNSGGVGFASEMEDVILTAKDTSVLMAMSGAIQNVPNERQENNKATRTLELLRALSEIDFEDTRNNTLDELCVSLRTHMKRRD